MKYPNFVQFFMADHDKNLVGAKFNIGDKVKVTHRTGIYEGEVLAVAHVGEDEGYEYAVTTMEFLAWESEMEALS
jgi:hypothetical protein